MAIRSIGAQPEQPRDDPLHLRLLGPAVPHHRALHHRRRILAQRQAGLGSALAFTGNKFEFRGPRQQLANRRLLAELERGGGVAGVRLLGPESAGPDTASVALEMPASSLLLYLGTLWHGGGEDRSEAPRLGVNVLYAKGWLRPYENQYFAVPRELAATLPLPLQRLLGYGVYGEYLGYVDGRHSAGVLKG